jgi:hypothetical protein
MEEISRQEYQERQDSVNSEITGIKVAIAELPEKISDKLCDKFASKLTEKIVYGLCTLILLAVASAVVGLVVYAK